MKIKFNNSKQYWTDRYRSNGNSGPGSYGRLAEFKASVINDFVETNQISSVIEFGCGDGNQLSLSNYKNYIGLDVAEDSINLCKKRFLNDITKSFYMFEDYKCQIAEVSLSLDVIFHLIEDSTFNEYMQCLFNSASRFVIIYSSNTSVNLNNADHVKHRKFTEVVDNLTWSLIKHIPNRYPYSEKDPKNTSFSDFYIFQKII